MIVWFDTSVISKLFVAEADSHRVVAARARFRPRLVLAPIQRFELKNAWQLKVFRGEMPPSKAAEAVCDLTDEIRSGLWFTPEIDTDAVHRRAEDLSSRFSARFGTRSLDVLHVAHAIEVGAAEFLTADTRQARLAEAAGLTLCGMP